jgi:hypothetical protein
VPRRGGAHPALSRLYPVGGVGNPDFQAEEKGSGNPFYQIFTLDLASGKFRRVSTGCSEGGVAAWRRLSRLQLAPFP